VQLATSNGRIVLDLPEHVDADVDIRVDNGVIRNDRELCSEGTRDQRPRRGAARVSGGKLIKLRTSNGSVLAALRPPFTSAARPRRIFSPSRSNTTPDGSIAETISPSTTSPSTTRCGLLAGHAQPRDPAIGERVPLRLLDRHRDRRRRRRRERASPWLRRASRPVWVRPWARLRGDLRRGLRGR
jgi:hypothetical protein